MARRLDEQHLQRRPRPRLDQVPAAGAVVAPAEHDMGMQLGCAVVQRRVAQQRQHLDPLVDRDPLAVPPLPVKAAEHHVTVREGRPLSASMVLPLTVASLFAVGAVIAALIGLEWIAT
jgi:hypothetical protein